MSLPGIAIVCFTIVAALVLTGGIVLLLLYDMHLQFNLNGKKKKHGMPETSPDSEKPAPLLSRLLLKKEIPFGSSIIILGGAPEKVHYFLKENFDEKCHEIIFSRVHERILREKYEFRANCTFFWITHKPESDFQISVSDISKLFWNIKQVALNLKRTIIYIDCLEYLVFINSFSPVMRMVNEVIDLISNLQITFVISIDPRAFEEKELSLIERSVGIVYDERQSP